MGIAVNAETASSGLLIGRRKDSSDDPLTLKSGVKSIAPQDTIWKSVKLFYIARKC
jgi:hypothetical protein